MSQSGSDLDYDTDQSTRVERRVANGIYRLTHAGRDIGEEVWSVLALRNGGFRLMMEIELQWPVPHQQRAQLDADSRWSVQTLWAQVDLNRTRRMAMYAPAGGALDVEVVEARLRADEEHTGKKRVLRATSGDFNAEHLGAVSGKVVGRQHLPFTATTHLDFASAMFNFVALQRLQLPRDGRMAFDAVVLTLPSLEPLQVMQTYCYERDEPLPGAMPFSPAARRYSITETGGSVGETVTTFWTDGHGIPLSQELTLEGAPHGCEMVSYQWQG